MYYSILYNTTSTTTGMSVLTMIYMYKYLNVKLIYIKIYNHACFITHDQGSLIKKKRFAAQERNVLNKTKISSYISFVQQFFFNIHVSTTCTKKVSKKYMSFDWVAMMAKKSGIICLVYLKINWMASIFHSAKILVHI